MFLTILDLTSMNIALPAIGRDFPGVATGGLAWILTVYAIVFAATLVPAGRWGDRRGRRRAFHVGLILFVAGSVIAAATPWFPLLLIGRAVQAVGAGIATPNSLAVLLPMFAPAQRPKVIAGWGVLASLGAAAGPPLGGLLADVDWRLIFVLNLPLGVACLAGSRRLVPEVRGPANAPTADLTGAAALAVGVAALTLALTQGPDWEWDYRVWALLAGGAAATVVAVRRSRNHPAPIIDPGLFREPAFGPTMVAATTYWAAFAALLLASSLYLTQVMTMSVLEAGLGMTPGAAVSAVAAIVGSRLVGKTTPSTLAVLGMASSIAGFVLLLTGLHPGAAYSTAFLPGQLLIGIGTGLTIPCLMALTLAHVPPPAFSTAVSVYTVFRQVGTALGTAAWVALVASRPLGLPGSYRAGWIAMIAFTAISVAAIAVLRRRQASPAPPTVAVPNAVTSPSP